MITHRFVNIPVSPPLDLKEPDFSNHVRPFEPVLVSYGADGQILRALKWSPEVPRPVNGPWS